MLDPARIQMAAQDYQDENQRFRRFLKSRADPDELDRHFSDLHKELFAGYDCCQCANCCREYSVSLEDDEAAPIATFLGLATDDFISKYLTPSAGGYEIKAPCAFLGVDGKCGIQECKPAECREFPYTDKPDRIISLLGVMSFAETCPVVFEIVQRLKEIYRFRGRD